MTRKKVKLIFMSNDNARRASLKKRRAGLVKKVSELMTLCDVKTCLIIYSPDEAEPTVWPGLDVASSLIQRFFALPEVERKKKAMNQETYLKERTGKVQEQLTRNQRKNKEAEMEHLMYQLNNQSRYIDGLILNDLYGMIWFVREKIKDLRKRMEFIQLIPIPQTPGHIRILMEQVAALVAAQMGGGGRLGPQVHSEYLMDQWFFNMAIGNTNFNFEDRNDDNNNDDNHGNGDNNNDDDDEGLVTGNPSEPQIGQMPYGNPDYGNFGDPSLNHQYGNFFGGQGSANPNMEIGLQPYHPEPPQSHPHHGGFDNLGLGLMPPPHPQPYYHQNMNFNDINEGNMNLGGGFHMGLGLHPHEGERNHHMMMGNELGLQQPYGSRGDQGHVMGRELGLQSPRGGHGLMGSDLGLQPQGGGHGLMGSDLGLQPQGGGHGLMGNELVMGLQPHGGGEGQGTGGFLGSGLSLQPHEGAESSNAARGNQMGLPFGLFGGENSSGGGGLGFPYDGSKNWPNNNNFSQ